MRQEKISYPAYQVKSFGKVVEITEDRVGAHSAFDRISGGDKELYLVQANGAAKCLRRA